MMLTKMMMAFVANQMMMMKTRTIYACGDDGGRDCDDDDGDDISFQGC